MFYQIITLIKVFFSWEQNPVVTEAVSVALLNSKGLCFHHLIGQMGNYSMSF